MAEPKGNNQENKNANANAPIIETLKDEDEDEDEIIEEDDKDDKEEYSSDEEEEIERKVRPQCIGKGIDCFVSYKGKYNKHQVIFEDEYMKELEQYYNIITDTGLIYNKLRIMIPYLC